MNRSASSRQCTCPFYSSCASFLGKASHHPGLSAPLQPKFGSLRLLAVPKAKIGIEREDICECNSHAVHKLSQLHRTADWLAPQESYCLQMQSKVSSDWMSSYFKATHLVLKIFKMAGYFMDRPHIHLKTLHLMCPDSLRVTYEVFWPNETVGNICFLDRNWGVQEWIPLLHRVYDLLLLISPWIQFLDSGLLNFSNVMLKIIAVFWTNGGLHLQFALKSGVSHYMASNPRCLGIKQCLRFLTVALLKIEVPQGC